MEEGEKEKNCPGFPAEGTTASCGSSWRWMFFFVRESTLRVMHEVVGFFCIENAKSIEEYCTEIKKMRILNFKLFKLNFFFFNMFDQKGICLYQSLR